MKSQNVRASPSAIPVMTLDQLVSPQCSQNRRSHFQPQPGQVSRDSAACGRAPPTTPENSTPQVGHLFTGWLVYVPHLGHLYRFIRSSLHSSRAWVAADSGWPLSAHLWHILKSGGLPALVPKLPGLGPESLNVGLPRSPASTRCAWMRDQHCSMGPTAPVLCRPALWLSRTCCSLDVSGRLPPIRSPDKRPSGFGHTTATRPRTLMR